jgi:hypothetical protein
MDGFIGEFNRSRESRSSDEREGMREVMRKSTARRSLFDKPKA